MAEFKQGLCNCFGDCGVCKLSRIVFCCRLQSYLQAAAATGASRARRTRPRRASASPGSSTRSSPASSPASPCCSSDRRPGRGDFRAHNTIVHYDDLSRYNIEGDTMGDVVASVCCTPCVGCQVSKEVQERGDQ